MKNIVNWPEGMKPKFTDAPWRVNADNVIAPNVEKGVQTGMMGVTVARVERWPGYRNECRANAALIAAAPEMFEMLAEAMCLLQGSGNPHFQDRAEVLLRRASGNHLDA